MHVYMYLHMCVFVSVCEDMYINTYGGQRSTLDVVP